MLNGAIQLQQGETYALTYGEQQTDPKIIPIDYRDLANDVKEGDLVMMNDGLLRLRITACNESDIEVEVLDGGELKSRKGVNFPDSMLSMPAMTEKDNRDLMFGIANKVDVIALSFVQRANDVFQCKKMIKALGSDIPIIAKIEKISAVTDIDEIAQAADGLMVARGDLGVEANVERVPLFQRRIIDAAAAHSRPVIIATQMLESMIKNPQASPR